MCSDKLSPRSLRSLDLKMGRIISSPSGATLTGSEDTRLRVVACGSRWAVAAGLAKAW